MSKISKLYASLFPTTIRKLIDPGAFKLRHFVSSEIQNVKARELILDAGAGECGNKDFITNQSYIALDAACGDQSWNYSGLDVIADLENTPFIPNCFHLVICTQVMEHVKEPQAVLLELFRVMKEEGVLCLSAPQGWGVHQAPYDFFRFTHFGLNYLLKKAGFNHISIIPSCGYFGYLANRLTVLPKTLFWPIKTHWLRVLLFPFEVLFYAIFVFLLPILLNSIDFLDKDRNYTLNYLVRAKKPSSKNIA